MTPSGMISWSLPPTKVSSLPPLAEAVEIAEGVGDVGDVARARLRDRRVAVDGHGVPVEGPVMRVPVELGDAERERIVPLRLVSAVPRSRPYQTRLPSALCGPSQIMSIAIASLAFRQLAAGAVDAPQTLAVALNLHWRGSSRTPSVTPAIASHAATADAVAWFSLAAAIGPPVRSFMTTWPHI